MLDSIFQEDIDKAGKGGLSVGLGGNGGQHGLLHAGKE